MFSVQWPRERGQCRRSELDPEQSLHASATERHPERSSSQSRPSQRKTRLSLSSSEVESASSVLVSFSFSQLPRTLNITLCKEGPVVSYTSEPKNPFRNSPVMFLPWNLMKSEERIYLRK